MKNITLPHFGTIELEHFDDGYTPFKYDYSIGALYGDDFSYNGTPIELDVNFTELTNSNIILVTTALNDLDAIISAAKRHVDNDFKTSNTVRDYFQEWITYHLKEEPFKGLVPEPFDEKTPELLLNKLEIVRIGFYALVETEPFIVIDFAFGYDIDSGYRDDMVVLKLDAAYALQEISTEG